VPLGDVLLRRLPNAPNNTVIERVLVDGVRIYRGMFTFNGPEASNTVAINVPPGHHRVVA
jgi:hypothetical protein